MRAKATCKCKKCGAVFFRYAEKATDDQAIAWKEWTTKNITLCTACYKKSMREENRFVAHIDLDYNTLSIVCWYTTADNDLPSEKWQIIRNLKDFGWETDPANKKKRRWQRVIPLQQYLAGDTKDMLRSAYEVKTEYDPEVYDQAVALLERAQKVNAAEVVKELSKLKEPHRPSCVPAGQWNHKVYGKDDHCVYVDGRKFILSKEDVARVAAHSETYKKYEDLVAAVKAAYA